MGRMYAIFIAGIAVSAIQDVFEYVASANNVAIIHSIVITQSTDYGDTEAEGLRIEITRGHTTSGSGGAAVTPTPLDDGMPAASGTAERNNTTQALGGSPVTIHAEAFNAQVGFFYKPTPEERIKVNPSQRIVVELPVAPTDAMTVDATMIIEEIGG